MYDITDKESFSSVNSWINDLLKYASQNVVTYLVGNKCDLEENRVISLNDGDDCASQLGIEFFETSAKSNLNIDKLFLQATKEALERRGISVESETIKFGSKKKPKKSGCLI